MTLRNRSPNKDKNKDKNPNAQKPNKDTYNDPLNPYSKNLNKYQNITSAKKISKTTKNLHKYKISMIATNLMIVVRNQI